VIVGSKTAEQLAETIEQIQRGRLSEKSMDRIERIWERIKHEAPVDNFEIDRKRGAST
jgi:aflatoxin B1 aldehyde reductase